MQQNSHYVYCSCLLGHLFLQALFQSKKRIHYKDFCSEPGFRVGWDYQRILKMVWDAGSGCYWVPKSGNKVDFLIILLNNALQTWDIFPVWAFNVKQNVLQQESLRNKTNKTHKSFGLHLTSHKKQKWQNSMSTR